MRRPSLMSLAIALGPMAGCSLTLATDAQLSGGSGSSSDGAVETAQDGLSPDAPDAPAPPADATLDTTVDSDSGADVLDGAADAVVEGGDACVPLTCAQLGVCGNVGNGCGGTVTCNCPNGEACGADGGCAPAGCVSSPQCTAGATRMIACGNCGTETDTCSAQCAWQLGSCAGQGACQPGATQSCASACGTGSQTCQAGCAWGSCSSASIAVASAFDATPSGAGIDCNPPGAITPGDGAAAGLGYPSGDVCANLPGTSSSVTGCVGIDLGSSQPVGNVVITAEAVDSVCGGAAACCCGDCGTGNVIDIFYGTVLGSYTSASGATVPYNSYGQVTVSIGQTARYLVVCRDCQGYARSQIQVDGVQACP